MALQNTELVAHLVEILVFFGYTGRVVEHKCTPILVLSMCVYYATSATVGIIGRMGNFGSNSSPPDIPESPYPITEEHWLPLNGEENTVYKMHVHDAHSLHPIVCTYMYCMYTILVCTSEHISEVSSYSFLCGKLMIQLFEIDT